VKPEANLLNVWDYERLAEEALDEASFGYFAGGAGDEHTVRGNLEAFSRWRLRPRVLVDVGEVTTLDADHGGPGGVPADGTSRGRGGRRAGRRWGRDDHLPLVVGDF
jgi:hypothetical protein